MDPTQESVAGVPAPADPSHEASAPDHEDREAPRLDAADRAVEGCLVCVTAADRRRYH